MPDHSQSEKRKLTYPIIQRIRLAHFSLYTLKDPIEFECKEGITCIAGANGLGKSTFLQIVGYGLTGVVPKPGQKFVAVDEYYRDLRAFTRDYFGGRLLPEDRDVAQIELELTLGDARVTIIRSFVDSDQLFYLRIVTDEGEEEFLDASPEERNEAYQALIANKVGLGSFKEFVFVQSLVFTFDERRHLLFWDPKVLETCLLIFVGVGKEERSKVEKLRRDWERAESRVRNLTYDIKQAKDRLAAFEAALNGQQQAQEDSKSYEEYEELLNRAKSTTDEVTATDTKIRDARLSIADSASRTSALRAEYKSEFELRISTKRTSLQHPLVKTALIDGKCNVCGSEGDQIISTVKAKVESKCCPLCDTKLTPAKEDPKLLERLKSLDEALAQEKRLLESQTLRVTQLQGEREKWVLDQNAAIKEVTDFEEKHGDVVAGRGKKTSDFDTLKKVYEDQVASILKERDKERESSKKILAEYRLAQKKLEQRYLDVQENFVPLFSSLAKLFLGVDLDITMEHRESSVTLVLEVKNSKRREDYQLSESQRFFIDIALRMAFAQFASPENHKAPLYIDTPEGSLDLAYESQAGQMIARFSAEGHKVLMTANINTSQLLQSIASNSARCGFGVQRLYQWTEMSGIQEKQEKKFDSTLDEIEKLAKRARI